MDTTPVYGLYTKNTLVWIEDKQLVWRCCRLQSDIKPGDSQIRVEDFEDPSFQLTVKIVTSPVKSTDGKNAECKLPALKNPDILIGANDLTSLSYLHEPAVLHNLRVRFLDQGAIYTWCGIVLVAVNPFTDLPIYGDETIRTYHDSNQSGGTTQLDPHIYAVAEDAFSKLERESRNQSLIVSGESGAGKTVSAKFAMRYFASIATGSCSSASEGNSSINSTGSIEKRVLASNPIMEAIGNAKTTRNDNSSRFGKYIQIMFDPFTKQSIVGGNMRTYLLEKSRITKQSEGERNFHLFYQICSYAETAKLDSLMLYNESGFYNFRYLGGITPSTSDDLTRFNEAMSILGFPQKQQDLIYKIVASILHAGEINFNAINEEQCMIDEDDFHLSIFCSLLALDKDKTRKWLTQRVLKTGTEIIDTPVNKGVAISGRDALVKFLYERMFNWVVSLINKALGVLKAEMTSTFIGVLDIYGFEHFEINSFEQFCINYANEVLQQQFNQHVFKLEQEEYVREGIDWTFITFTDNQPVIDLIEARLGILSLLDEECKMPKGNDESWNLKLYDQLANKFKEIFQKPKFGARDSFIVQHFADKVTYSVHGFLDKNRDTVWEEQINLLKSSHLLEPVFIEFPNDGPVIKTAASSGAGGVKTKITPNSAPAISSSSSKLAKATVGSQFRESLSALMNILNSTTPHYVRCIKSNDDKAPFEFDNVRAVQQLRACGVLETIRISSNGFPSRWTYQDFSNRYRVLLVGVHRFVKRKVEASDPPVPLPRKLIRPSPSSNPSELRAVCEQIVKLVYELRIYSQFQLPFEMKKENESTSNLYQFGKSKIFFRSGQVALLERIRTQRLRECAILIQKTVKGFIYRRRYLRIQESILKLQTAIRGYIARQKYWSMKSNRAATIIQTAWRRHSIRKKYLSIRRAALGIQKYARARLARVRFLVMQKEFATITIQRWWRGYRARKVYHTKLRQIILVQSCVRRYFAKKQLKLLKVEARSVQHVQQLNKGLERKIIELQQKLNEMAIELKESRNKESNISEVKAVSARLDSEIKNLKNAISDKDRAIEKLKELVETKDKYSSNVDKQLHQHLRTIEKLEEEKKNLQNTLDQKIDIITRINQELIVLREKCDNLEVENKKLRVNLMRQSTLGDDNDLDQLGGNGSSDNDSIRSHLGMYKYNTQKEQYMLDALITHLEPSMALHCTPHLPSYIIFMCVRYNDEINDDNQVRSLLNCSIMRIKNVIKRASQSGNTEILVLWLSNTVKFVICLKQFSGDEPFGLLDESLKNFDLSEYRKMFSDIAIWIYGLLIKQGEERLQPLIVPGVLEYEGLASSGIYTQPKQRTGSISQVEPNVPSTTSDKPAETLIKELSQLHKMLMLHVVEPELISQIFKQLFYYICAGALNHLLLRKDLCHWNKAMQIRFNLSALEQWAREEQIPKANEIVEKLDPIIQATKLLQTKKTEDSIPTIVEMCNKLNSSQIIKILSLYTAGDEEVIPSTFMKKIQKFLVETRSDPAQNGPLLMDSRYNFAITIPYNPSDVDFRKITLPQILLRRGLGTILTKV